MPVMVPAKPVIAAKTSLFHARSNAKCAISSAVRLKVNAMANLTPRTRRSLGGTSAHAVLSMVFRVKARLIQSAMVPHPLLSQATVETALVSLHSFFQQEAVQQIFRFLRLKLRLDDDGGICGPRYRHRRVVYVV